MRPGQIIYTFFHFAANEKLTRACLEKKIVALAYETVQKPDGSLPLLKPMSEVAGRMAPLMGAFYISKMYGGRGLLPTGVPGVTPASVLIIGGRHGWKQRRQSCCRTWRQGNSARHKPGYPRAPGQCHAFKCFAHLRGRLHAREGH